MESSNVPYQHFEDPERPRAEPPPPYSQDWTSPSASAPQVPTHQQPRSAFEGVDKRLTSTYAAITGSNYGSIDGGGGPQPSVSRTIIMPPPPPPPRIIFVGGCPVCQVGSLEDDFTWMGILLAILFFPFGIICCLALRQRVCRNCGTVFI